MSIQSIRGSSKRAHQLDQTLEKVAASIRQCGSALVAFSGGVDSSVVAALAKQILEDKAVAVTVKHFALRPGEIEHAASMARTIGIRHLSVDVDLLRLPEVKGNAIDRCYHCKKLTFGALRRLADSLQLNAVLDGSNASDVNGYRPGLNAAGEMHVVSPLLDVAKDEVRSLARLLGLPNADKPSAACLLTSLPYGTTVTKERIERLISAERTLDGMSITQARVRDHDGFARIEVRRDEAEKVIANSAAIAETFAGLGFSYVTLDLEWFRSGSMDLKLNNSRNR
jgi:pyridinium-3,5-biscarboxylic acid mononucleotide sulfurtransferase